MVAVPNGELAGKRIRFHGDVCTDGEKAITQENARDLFSMLAAFISWTPIVPKKPKDLAAFLAHSVVCCAMKFWTRLRTRSRRCIR